MKIVFVHGAWHTGELLESTAQFLRSAGHEVFCPTIAGNDPNGTKDVGLEEAINSIVDFVNQNDLSDIVLAGHSYGGMVITGTYDKIPDKIRRLVYVNAFVPNNGECLDELAPPHYSPIFQQIAAASPDNTVMLPFPVWREAFINDADLALAKSTHDKLNAHPYRTFTDKISLSKNPTELV